MLYKTAFRLTKRPRRQNRSTIGNATFLVAEWGAEIYMADEKKEGRGVPEAKIVRGEAYFQQQLRHQLDFLQASGRAFDAGMDHEAIRLAGVIRTLVHDKGNSTSLLKHLKIKDQIRFVDTGLYRELLDAEKLKWLQSLPGVGKGATIASIRPGEAGLVEIVIRKGIAGWAAPLREQRFPPNSPNAKALLPPQPFDQWWTRRIIETSEPTYFSREDLIRTMADKDGHAHVDGTVGKDYVDLHTDFLGVEIEINGPDRTMDKDWEPTPVENNVAYASVRQIAWEVEETIKRHLLTVP
jgi:hypothetical protein